MPVQDGIGMIVRPCAVMLQNMTGKDSNVIAKAAIPFFFCLVVCIALITIFPSIVTLRPDLMMGVEK